MPTRSARNHRQMNGQDGGIFICGGAPGDLAPAAAEILDLIAASDCILGTGHLSPSESALLIREARARGVRRILVTHPEWKNTYFPVEMQKDLAEGGSVSFERCFVSTTHRCGFTPMKTIADAIAQVGIETTVLSSDLGQPDTPPPAEGLRLYADRLRSFGFSPEQLHAMMSQNPRRLLGISPEASTPAAK